ncbi:MAG: hypothetical protein HKM28_01810 [Flavobacteriaceae bacterium]|nr:hypothetical protein [Flavobacteriaceae bacterium]
MLTEFLGNDLSKISNELDKLLMLIPAGSQITPELIEENIGISKDFNNFELQKAIGDRNVEKAFRIIQYFGQNQKNHPVIVTCAILYGFFTKVMKYHALTNKKDAARSLGISPFFLDDYAVAAQNYPMKKVSSIISTIREVDLKGKGVGAAHISEADLLKELLIKIFN